MVERDGVSAPLWFAVEPPWAEFLTSDRLDSFMLALLPSAMRLGMDLRVRGAVSERLFYNLSHHYSRILSLLSPGLHRVRILPDELVRTPLREGHGGVVTAFSGGVDSFAVFADHYLGAVPATFRITHALNANVGAHGRTEESSALFRVRTERFRAVLDEWGVPLVRVDSNLHHIVHARTGLVPQLDLAKTHPVRNAAAALVLQPLFGRYLYGSGYSYRDCHIGRRPDIAGADPAAMHLLSTETTESVSVGCQYTRVEKTARVADVMLARRHLDVCSKRLSRGNCSVCRKCARTLLTLEVLGRLEDFRDVFNLEKYRRVRSRHLVLALEGREPLLREIAQAIRARKFPVPLACRVSAALRLHGCWPGRRLLK